MMTPVAVGIYIFLCLLLAIAGRRTRVGGLGVFLAAILFTPLLVGIVLAAARPLPGSKPPIKSGGG